MKRNSSFVLVLGLLGGLTAQATAEVGEGERALLARVEQGPSTPASRVVDRTSPLDGEAVLLNHGKAGTVAEAASLTAAAPLDGARALLNVAPGSERGQAGLTSAAPARGAAGTR